MRFGTLRKLISGLALLLLVSFGWLPSAAQDSNTHAFEVRLKLPFGNSMSRGEIGAPVHSCFSYDSFGRGEHYQGLGRVIEVLSISPQAVVLRIRMKYFDYYVDSDQAQEETMKVKPRDITYVPGQEISLFVEGYNSPVILSGSIVNQPETRIIPVKFASVLPKQDELNFSNIIFLRDRTEVILGTNPHEPSFGQCKESQNKSGTCAITIYIPKHGLFVFSLQPMEGSVEGMLVGSELSFEEGGHSYLLCSSLPINTGDFPGKVWILHMKDYLPSQHCGPKSEDDLKGIGSDSAGSPKLLLDRLTRNESGQCP